MSRNLPSSSTNISARGIYPGDQHWRRLNRPFLVAHPNRWKDKTQSSSSTVESDLSLARVSRQDRQLTIPAGKRMRSSELATITIASPEGRTTELLDLVDAWAGHVMRLSVEAHQDSDSLEFPWGVHDFIAALYIRDRVEHGIRQRSLSSNADIPPTVAVADELFRSFTLEDRQGTLQSVAQDAPTDPWWWRRLPKTGPVIAELHAIFARRRRADVAT